MQKSVFALRLASAFAAAALFTGETSAGPPNVKGKISGYEKLVSEVYAEAAKPESRRWTWREPSPSVDPKFRALAPHPPRDICVAAITNGTQEKRDYTMSVTGGQVYPTTIVVTPNTALTFKNLDPFKHRIYVVSGNGQTLLKADDLEPNATRMWAAQGPGRYEVRDALFPSVRSYVVVEPQVAAIAYPGRDGAFTLSLPAGNYVLKAFFNGKPSGKPMQVTASEKVAVELSEPLKLDEGM